MQWELDCDVARVRMLAIAAEVRAGGRPGQARMRHALEPIVGHFVVALGAAGRAGARTSPACRRPGLEEKEL